MTIDGEARWNFQRKAVQSAIARLVGVKGITNNIKLKQTVQPIDVKNKIQAAYQRSASLDSAQINISVSDGTVTLSGTVRSYAEKKDAEKAAWLVPGVTRVINQLEIEIGVYA